MRAASELRSQNGGGLVFGARALLTRVNRQQNERVKNWRVAKSQCKRAFRDEQRDKKPQSRSLRSYSRCSPKHAIGANCRHAVDSERCNNVCCRCGSFARSTSRVVAVATLCASFDGTLHCAMFGDAAWRARARAERRVPRVDAHGDRR